MKPTRTRQHSANVCRLLAVAATLALLLPHFTLAQGGSPCAPVPDGGVVTFGGNASSIDAALFGNGSGVVVWSASGDGDRQAAFGHRFNASGVPLGQPFVMNTLVEQDQFEVAVAAAPNGRFVAVWTSDVSPGDDEGSSIRGRVFLPNGAPLGPDFQVNSSIFGPQKKPDVAMASDGSFVATWYDDSDAPGSSQKNGREVRARRFNANGTPAGPDFIVNNRTGGTQDNPAIAMRADGRFVVVFSTSSDSPGNDPGRSIQARLFQANASPVANQFQVNNEIAGTQNDPAVAIDPDGTFLVTWMSSTSQGSDQDSNSIQARGYTANGSAAGPQKQVNQIVTKSQFDPVVASAGGREFMVAWLSRADGDQVKARALTLEAQPLGTEFRAGGFSNESTFLPAVAGNGAGRVATFYERSQEVRGQFYGHPCVQGGGGTDCVETANTLCLNSDRFKVTVVYNTKGGDSGQGNAFELTPDSGYFWFFDSANVEAVIKVLDACVINNHFWVFIGGLTDLNVQFEIEDMETREIRRYENPQGVSYETVSDNKAFKTCS